MSITINIELNRFVASWIPTNTHGPTTHDCVGLIVDSVSGKLKSDHP